MNQLHLEHLLPATSPRPDRALAGPVRTAPGDAAFGDQLAQRVATPSDPPKKIAARPPTEPDATPEGNWQTEGQPSQEVHDSPPDARTEDETATSQAATNDSEDAAQEDNDDGQSTPEAESALNAPAMNDSDEAKNDGEAADDGGSPDDSDDSGEAVEAAIVVNTHAIVQANKAKTAERGKASNEQDAPVDPKVASAKSPAIGGDSQAAKHKPDATIVNTELLQTEQATAETATGVVADDEKVVAAAAEHGGVPSHRKKDSGRAESKGEAAKTVPHISERAVGDKGGDCVTVEANTQSPGDLERTSTRPARTTRPSAKKERAGSSDLVEDSPSETARSAPRAEVANNNHAAAGASPAAGITGTADATKVHSSDNTIASTPTRTRPANSPVNGLVNSLEHLHRGGGHLSNVARTAESQDTPQVDVARFVGRVSKAFHSAQQRGGSLQLRLSPPELGALRLELTVKDGALTAALQTETDAARRVLLDHLPALRDRLAEQNIRIERFDVAVRREDDGGQADGRMLHHQQQRQQEQQPHNRTPRRVIARPTADVEAMRAAPGATTSGDRSGLNVVA